jgi:hypothetical protein
LAAFPCTRGFRHERQPAPRNKGAIKGGPGTLLYFPANVVHSTVATQDGDVVFFTVKDLSHGIIGKAADGTMAGPHYDPGFEPEKP